MASKTGLFTASLNRESITFSGEPGEQEDFLQSLVTNDMSKAGTDRLVYTALLTPQGKYLSDFFVYRTAKGDFVLDVAASLGEALEKRLKMYLLRRPLKMSRDATQVTAIWGDGEIPETALPDPRDPQLGWRIYDADTAQALENTTPGDYDLHRLNLAIPESGADLIVNDSYILEAGFEHLNGVDFRKGCYVGQEIVARMKHKTELRKGYRLVSVQGNVQPGETITTAEGKPAGTLYSNRDGVGLALLRLDRANTSDKLSSDGSALEVIQSTKLK